MTGLTARAGWEAKGRANDLSTGQDRDAPFLTITTQQQASLDSLLRPAKQAPPDTPGPRPPEDFKTGEGSVPALAGSIPVRLR
jgi:hypothetical protein